VEVLVATKVVVPVVITCVIEVTLVHINPTSNNNNNNIVEVIAMIMAVVAIPDVGMPLKVGIIIIKVMRIVMNNNSSNHPIGRRQQGHHRSFRQKWKSMDLVGWHNVVPSNWNRRRSKNWQEPKKWKNVDCWKKNS
jgi:hypothetical protein